MTGWKRIIVLAGAALMVAGVGTGCAGAPEDVSASSALVGSAPPMMQAPAGVLEYTPAGCEGLLETAVDFEIVSLGDALIVAIDSDGIHLCVDTLEAVEAELGESGREAIADQVHARFVETLFEGLGGETYIDPTPQPNSEGLVMGDPTPQPNTNPDDGGDGSDSADPTPQPNTNPDSEGLDLDDRPMGGM